MTGPLFATPAEFRAALLESGILVASSVDGIYQRSGEFEDLVDAVRLYAGRQRVDTTAPRRHLGPVYPRADFLRTDYLRSFPDLIGSIDVFSGSDRDHASLLADLEAGDDWTDRLVPAEVVLSSAVCHALYGTLPPQIPAAGLLFECEGFAFRHEPSVDPTRMQSFRMYEFVQVGTPSAALHHRDAWRDRGASSLAALGLPVRVVPANDPFFGRVGAMLADSQRQAELKYEVVVDVTQASPPTAIASANYHEDHFGLSFGLTTPDGLAAHTACFGYGLDRIALALLAHHGLASSAWPREVSETLSS